MTGMSPIIRHPELGTWAELTKVKPIVADSVSRENMVPPKETLRLLSTLVRHTKKDNTQDKPFFIDREGMSKEVREEDQQEAVEAQ